MSRPLIFETLLLEGLVYSNSSTIGQDGYFLSSLLIDPAISTGTVLSFWGTIDPNPKPSYPGKFFVDNNGNYFTDNNGNFFIDKETSSETEALIFQTPGDVGYSLIDYTYTVSNPPENGIFITNLEQYFTGFTGIIIQTSTPLNTSILFQGALTKSGIY